MTVLIISSMSSSLVHLSFAINQGYIAKKLCVDRDVDDSSCNGKCYLKQKINKEEEKKEDPVKNMNNREFNFIWHAGKWESFINAPASNQERTCHLSSTLSSGFEYPNERPPCYLS